MKTPVLLLIYNRPKETLRLFRAIEKIKPRFLYIFSDGPKKNEADIKKNNLVKKIFNNISWRCEVKFKYLDENLGCKYAVKKALDWFFCSCEMGIILEDDCIPGKDFFRFANLMLKKYQNRSNVFTISGNNFLKNNIKISESYYFSKYNHCWGWASWRRAWVQNDFRMNAWPKLKSTNYWNDLHETNSEKKYWKKIFNHCKSDKIDSWAYPWLYSIWKNKGINILPSKNLVKNIGFGQNATHTVSSKKINYRLDSLSKPIRHPAIFRVNKKADLYTYENFIKGCNFLWPRRGVYLIIFLFTDPKSFFIKITKAFRNIFI
jgi:hypothetical protein